MIYLDNAASTRVDDAVIARMAEVMRADYGNPSAAHPFGAAARRRIATARGQVLAALGDPDGAAGELVWTSGGTEGNALAVLGAARAAGPGAVVVPDIAGKLPGRGIWISADRAMIAQAVITL